MASYKNERVCIFAANERAEKKQREKGKIPELRRCRAKSYLICQQCGTMACHVCVREILSAIPIKEQCIDRWCSFVSENLTRLKKVDVFIDVGHCCELKAGFQNKKRFPNLNLKASPNTSSHQDEIGKPSRSQSKKKRIRRNKSKKYIDDAMTQNLVYSGYMHLLGMNILLDSPKNGVIDIHGMGTVGEKHHKNFVHGIMHCVLSVATSVRLWENGVRGKSFEQLRERNDVEVVEKNVTVHTSYGINKEYTVEIIRVPTTLPSRKTMEAMKGMNEVCDDVIEASYVFEDKDAKDGIDVTIITAKMPSEIEQDDVLVLLRFHRYFDPDIELGATLYKLLMGTKEKPIVGRSGFEVCRTGGSGGLTTNPYKDKLLTFLRYHPSSTPRCTKAIKVVQKRCSYKIYYIGVTEKSRKVARCSYTPPRRGGSFTVSAQQFIEWPFLADFAEAKLIATLILQSLRVSESPLFIATEAVSQELRHINVSEQIVNSVVGENLDRRMPTLVMYNEFNRHSLVSYNVGYHLDRFDKGMASLENKVVFKLPHRFLEPRSMDELIHHTRGGGQTKGDFHFALLDWGRNRRNRRQAAIDIGMIQPNQRLTQRTIDEFLQVNPHMNQVFADAQHRLNNNNNDEVN